MWSTSLDGIDFWFLLLGPAFCSPWVVSVILRMFDLRTLGSGRSKGASRRMKIHPICNIWQLRGGVFVSWLFQTGFFALMQKMITRGFFYVLVGSPPRIFCDARMCKGYTPSISVARLLGRSGFGNTVDRFEDAAIDDIQEITSLGGCLMWNGVTVYCGRVRLKFLVRVWLDMWKSLERECAMIFMSPWCVVSIRMSCYWQGSSWSWRIRHRVIMHSLGKSMPCSSNRVCWNWLWIPRCVNHVPVVGWSCILIL